MGGLEVWRGKCLPWILGHTYRAWPHLDRRIFWKERPKNKNKKSRLNFMCDLVCCVCVGIRTIPCVWSVAPHTGSVWAVGRSATKGCMQQATGSAQSINLPMSNLWHSDRQGHRQHGTDRHIIYKRTHTGKQTCLIILAVTVHSGALKGRIYRTFEVFRELSWCQSFECSWGLNVLLTLGNRSRPLFPSYRHRQRLCVLMCVGPGACWDMPL